MVTIKYLKSTVAAWLGGIWAHIISSCCSSDVVMMVCNFGYLWNQERPRVPCFHPLSCSAWKRSSRISMRLGAAPGHFSRVVEGRDCALDSFGHFIQLNIVAVIPPHTPERLTSVNITRECCIFSGLDKRENLKEQPQWENGSCFHQMTFSPARIWSLIQCKSRTSTPSVCILARVDLIHFSF